MSNNVCLVLFSVSLLASACGASVPPAPATASPTGTPTQLPKPITTRLLALHTGQLVMVGPCLRVQSTYGPDSYLLVWPADFESSVNGDTVVVSDLLERKQTTWHLGDIVQVGGGEIPRLDASLRPVPANCPGPYWVVSGWGTDFTPTPSPTRTPGPTFTAISPSPPPAGSVVAAEPVTLCAGPGTDYDSIGQLAVGQAYPVVGRLGQWWELRLPDGHTGWVVSLLVTFTGDAQCVPLLAAPPTPTFMPEATELTQGDIVLISFSGSPNENVPAPAGTVFASLRLPPSPTATWAPASVSCIERSSTLCDVTALLS